MSSTLCVVVSVAPTTDAIVITKRMVKYTKMRKRFS